MYPVLRVIKEFYVHRNDPPMRLDQTHVSHHICWPWDLDVFMELNNGRTLTLLDLGRLIAAKRIGLLSALRANGWSMTMAGVSVRYRRRIRVFDRVQSHTKFAGVDGRFVYLDQSFWKKGECTTQAFYRVAVTGPEGIVPTEDLVAAMGIADTVPPIPPAVQAWINAETQRPWPPS